MKQSKLLTAVTALLLALTLLSAAIAIPILCRPFYYAHIDALELPQKTGWSKTEIKTAYNEMLDYCLGGETFSTGVLRWSQSGKDHFTDVRGLFLLDLRVLVLCAVLLTGLTILSRCIGCRPARLCGRGAPFWAGVGLGTVFAVVGGLGALDFDRAFRVFHTLFFPGKSNWLFDPREDEIIRILPEVFFRNCAIAILGVLVLGCVLLIVTDLCRKRERNGADKRSTQPRERRK